MKTVHKYELIMDGVATLNLPEGAEILSAKAQRNKIVLYTLVDTNELPTDVYSVLAIGTGAYLDYDIDKYKFIDTVMLLDGALVYHVFALKGDYLAE